MDYYKWIEEFFNYLKSEKNASPATIRTYKSDFKLVKEFLESHPEYHDGDLITTPLLREFIYMMKSEKKFKVRTIRRKIHSLSSFFKFCLEMDYLIKNPMLPIHAPKEPDVLPIFISEGDLNTIINAPMRKKHKYSLRDQAIFMTFAYTGVRRKELIGLNWIDIDFGKNILKVRKGKGGKERLIPMHPKLIDCLWIYLQSRLPLQNDAVFLSEANNRITYSSLQLIFKNYLEDTRLNNKGYTLHKFRHSFATIMLKNGADLISVQKLLGHSDLNSTKVYTHLDTSILREGVSKLPNF